MAWIICKNLIVAQSDVRGVYKGDAVYEWKERTQTTYSLHLDVGLKNTVQVDYGYDGEKRDADFDTIVAKLTS